MINVRHVPIPPVSESSMYAAHLWTGQCQACQLTALWLLEKFPQPLALLKADCLLTNFSRHWQENLWICINLFFPFPVLRSKKSLEGASVLSHFENMSRTSPPAQLFSLFFFTSHLIKPKCPVASTKSWGYTALRDVHCDTVALCGFTVHLIIVLYISDNPTGILLNLLNIEYTPLIIKL